MKSSISLCLGLILASTAWSADRPNVVLVITDDQGYGDIAAHGNPVISTPALDRLHGESVRFTNFHVDPTCSPTRGALMSGKYSHRAKVWHTITGGNHLRATEVTMADVFENSGYRTGMFGKWHLGGNYPYRPIDRGFQEWLGHGDGGTGTTDDYFTNDRVNDHYLHNGEFEYREGYAPDVFFQAAIDFIQADNDEPFFVYLSTYIPHSPHTIPDKAWVDKYLDQTKVRPAYFFAAMEQVDHNIGILRKTLKQRGLADNTLLIFMTDNGGTAGVPIFNAGMRGSKGSAYEGGHRVPLFVHWPGGNIRHGADVDDLTAHFDLLPTLIDMCDLKSPSPLDLDGRSFKQQLIDPGLQLPERTLFVEKQRTYIPQKWNAAVAMNKRWRLVNNQELYDMSQDPGQKKNVMDRHPEIARQLSDAFDDYWEHVTPNDRALVRSVIGHPSDPETFLHSSDWFLPATAWSHGATSNGAKYSGYWLIAPHQAGRYEFELRRWPKEVSGPISGIPEIDKKVDAWDSGGAKRYLIYAGERPPFKALSVKFMRFTIGEFTRTVSVEPDDTHISIEVPLVTKDYEVRAEMLDAKKQLIAGAYYVYCRRVEQP